MEGERKHHEYGSDRNNEKETSVRWLESPTTKEKSQGMVRRVALGKVEYRQGWA
jgi:hypothetical protein